MSFKCTNEKLGITLSPAALKVVSGWNIYKCGCTYEPEYNKKAPVYIPGRICPKCQKEGRK